MARSHARLLTSIWRDSDFLALSASAQRAYMLVMSQPNLSYCGVISYTPKRWAGCAKDTTVKDIRRGIDELVLARFLLLDEETEELWVRSFIKHDQVLKQPNVAIAARKDAEAVQSVPVRDAIGDAFPELFAEPESKPSPNPSRNPSAKPSTNPSANGSGKAPSRDPLPPIPIPPLDDDPDPLSYPAAPESRTPSEPNGSSSSVVEKAALVFGFAQAATSQQAIDNPARYANGVARNVLAEQGERLRAYVAEHPSDDAESVAANVFKLDRWALIGARKAMP